MISENDSTSSRRSANPLARLRGRIRGGAYILLDSMSDEELGAMQTLLMNEEAEIVNSACKPFLVAKLDRIILPP